MSIGSRVRSARKAKGLSQEALGRGAGVSVNAVRALEQGVNTDPHVSTLSRLAGALNTSISELAGEEPPAPSAQAGLPEPPVNDAVEQGVGVRDTDAFQRALMIVIHETRNAWLRNGDKKDPRLEGPDFWLAKLEEEAGEVRPAWLTEDKERLFEEIGDVGNCLVGIILQGAYDLAEKERKEGAKT